MIYFWLKSLLGCNRVWIWLLGGVAFNSINIRDKTNNNNNSNDDDGDIDDGGNDMTRERT